MNTRAVSRSHTIGRLLLACVLACAAGSSAPAQEPQTPAETVDAFHAALSSEDTGGALSLLDPQVVVFEFGMVDANAEAYAFQHLPADMEIAARTEEVVESRQVNGEDGHYWVLSTYRVTGTDANGEPIDFRFLETAILRRAGDRFRIVHLHWSTDSAGPAGGGGARKPGQ